MAHRHSPFSRITSFETLEPRNLLSGTTTIPVDNTAAEVRNLLVPSADLSPEAQWAKGEGEGSVEEMQPREIYSIEKGGAFWEGVQEGQQPDLQAQRKLLSTGEALPTPENPVEVHVRYTMEGLRGGLQIDTRTDGTANKSLAFGVGYNAITVYLYDPAGSSYVITKQNFSANLEVGKTYDVTAIDTGKEARLLVTHEGVVLMDARGAIPKDPRAGKIAVQREDATATQRINLNALQITHGMEAKPKPVQQSLPEDEVDAVFSDTELVESLLVERLQAESALQDPDKIFEGLEDPVAFDTFFEARETKFCKQDAGLSGGELSVNERVAFLSRQTMDATPETPIILEMDFSFKAEEDGLVVLTRTDGRVTGGSKEQFENGLDFSVEKGGAGIFLWKTLGRTPMHQRIGQLVRYPALGPDRTYHLRVEDNGTSAHMVITEGDRIIAEVGGSVPGEPIGHQIALTNIAFDKPRGVILEDLEITYGGKRGEAIAKQEVQMITKDDPRVAQVLSTDYGNNAIASIEREKLYRESRYFVPPETHRAIAERHPAYGSNTGVNGDIEQDLNIQLAAYQDVIGDALLRGMELHLAQLKGEPTQRAMEGLDFVLNTRASGRYIRELAQYGITMPAKGEVLEESLFLLSANIDRLIANQEVVERQNWEDTHLGETAHVPKTKDESERITLNMQRGLRGAMVYTATVMANYSAEVRREFEHAVTYAGLNVQEIYAEAGVRQLYASAAQEAEVLPGVLHVRSLEIKDGRNVGMESMSLPAEGSETLRFTLDREVMANFWVNSVPGRALSLRISGKDVSYSSEHGLSSAISTSLKLTPGTYEVTVTDKTNYGVMPNGNELRSRALEFPLHMDVRPWNMREIVGRVSLPGESEAMEVSLRVAEFDENGARKKDYSSENGKDSISKLDPTKPVLVVAHGREDNENSGKMEMLAKELKASGYQVLTADWSGARDNFPHAAGMQGEQWIEPSAQKFYEMLNSLGVPGENVSFGAHSWASLLAFEVAERYKQNNGFGVQAIVALDPAKDPTLRWVYDAGQVDFSTVSNVSWGFHSSAWGSVPRTLTGGRATQIRSPGVWNITNEHGLAVTAFANLIRLQRQDPNNELASEFSLKSLESKQRVPCDEIFEGWMWVDSAEKIDKNGDPYIDAIPMKFTNTDPDDSRPDVYRNAFFSNRVQ